MANCKCVCIRVLGSLKQQKFILSQFWKMEVQNQSVGRVMLSLKALGEDHFLPLPSFWWLSSSPWHYLPCRCFTPLSASVFPWSAPLGLCPNFLLFINPPVIGWGPTPIQHDLILTFDHIYKDPISKDHTPRFQVDVNLRGTLSNTVQCRCMDICV